MSQVDFNILRERYASFYPVEPIDDATITALQSELDLQLPNDVKEIAQFYSGGFLGGISHYAFNFIGNDWSVVAETKRLRSAIGLSHRYIVLAEPPESLIALDCAAGVVIWCGAHDAYRFDDTSAMSPAPDIWPSYSKFFEFLLDEEQQEQDESRRD